MSDHVLRRRFRYDSRGSLRYICCSCGAFCLRGFVARVLGLERIYVVRRSNRACAVGVRISGRSGLERTRVSGVAWVRWGGAVLGLLIGNFG